MSALEKGIAFAVLRAVFSDQFVDNICTLISGEVDRQREPCVTVMGDVLIERIRQKYEEGFTPEHDDQYKGNELVAAAISYLAWGEKTTPPNWPWDPAWWKPGDRRRDLIKASALILAEIERIDRAAAAAAEKERSEEDGTDVGRDGPEAGDARERDGGSGPGSPEPQPVLGRGDGEAIH